MISHTLLVGTIGEGIFRSTDLGDSFRRAADGMFVECHVRALVCDPRLPRTVWAGTENGLYRSDNGADTWQLVSSPLDGQQIWSIHVHPEKPDLLFAGTRPPRLFRSDDGGETWGEPTIPFVPDCPRIIHNRLTCFATGGSFVWAGVEIDSVWRSRDDGVNWEKTPSGLSSHDIHSLVVVPARGSKPRRLLAATNNDLNLSEDDGQSWRPLDIRKQAPRAYCRSLAQIVGHPERVLLGVGDGPPGWSGFIVVSEDGGDNWRAAVLPGPANSTVWNFATHPADPSLVYASSVSGEVYRSEDAGASWVKLAREFGEIRSLAWLP
jgi:photosystem II stability/assembly factor-like uncharacterized protein